MAGSLKATQLGFVAAPGSAVCHLPPHFSGPPQCQARGAECGWRGHSEGHGAPGWGGGWARCLHQSWGGAQELPFLYEDPPRNLLVLSKGSGDSTEQMPRITAPRLLGTQVISSCLLSQAGPQGLPLSYIPLHVAMGRRNPPRALRGPTHGMLGLTQGGPLARDGPKPSLQSQWAPKCGFPGETAQEPQQAFLLPGALFGWWVGGRAVLGSSSNCRRHIAGLGGWSCKSNKKAELGEQRGSLWAPC